MKKNKLVIFLLLVMIVTGTILFLDFYNSKLNRKASGFNLREIIRYNEKFIEVEKDSLRAYGQFVVSDSEAGKDFPLSVDQFSVMCNLNTKICKKESVYIHRSNWSDDSDQAGDNRYSIDNFSDDFKIVANTLKNNAGKYAGVVTAEMDYTSDCGKLVLSLDLDKQIISQEWICDGILQGEVSVAE